MISPVFRRTRRPSLRVAVLHNYRDEQQPSMRLYAERLGDALLRRGRARHARAAARRRPRRLARPLRDWRKVDGYIGRFAVYPRLVRDLRADIIQSSTTARATWSAASTPGARS